jgi:hypothetical protein
VLAHVCLWPLAHLNILYSSFLLAWYRARVSPLPSPSTAPPAAAAGALTTRASLTVVSLPPITAQPVCATRRRASARAASSRRLRRPAPCLPPLCPPPLLLYRRPLGSCVPPPVSIASVSTFEDRRMKPTSQ